MKGRVHAIPCQPVKGSKKNFSTAVQTPPKEERERGFSFMPKVEGGKTPKPPLHFLKKKKKKPEQPSLAPGGLRGGREGGRTENCSSFLHCRLMLGKISVQKKGK